MGRTKSVRRNRIAGILLGGTTVIFSTCCASLAENALPKTPAPFAGKIDADRDKAVPNWPQQVKAPKDAPNIVIILLDDAGFGASSAFGGPVNTPVAERLAAGGLRYNNFHVNALCSPTRASLLSGRNNHQIGFGNIAERVSGYPGYNAIWPKSAASIAQVLKDNGYSTAVIGKWHNTPQWENNPSGPFDHWPTNLGFEYYYGFMGGSDSQYETKLFRNTLPVDPSAKADQGYLLNDDLADDAIKWLHTHDALVPNKPFFLYFAPGATHTPHHVSKEWIEKYRGKFDQGWDRLREEIFARQKALGIIPANAELTPRPKELPTWDSFTPEQKKYLAHQAEVYAGFYEQTDYEIGRVIKAIEEEGKADNTLVIYILGDNGASADGDVEGFDGRRADGRLPTLAERFNRIDELGSELHINDYAAGWGWGFNTPFQWTKQVASHLGGTTDPLIVFWPKRIKDKGGIRGQFEHLVDIAPTLYDAVGIDTPGVVDGVKQTPLEGKSFAYTYDDAKATSKHRIQYFETFGNRGIYQDGWWAGERHVLPWALESADKTPIGQHPWELYNLNEDYSQAHDLAEKNPKKLKELVALFDAEAKRNNAYPLAPHPGFPPAEERKHFVFRSGVERIPPWTLTRFRGRPHTIIADVTVPAGGANGVIVAMGGRYNGFSIYAKDGKLFYVVNTYVHITGRIASTKLLPIGKVHIEVDVTPNQIKGDVSSPETVVSGTARLLVNGTVVGEGRFANYFLSCGDTLDIGKDLVSAVDAEAYDPPFAFNGTVETVAIDFK